MNLQAKSPFPIKSPSGNFIKQDERMSRMETEDFYQQLYHRLAHHGRRALKWYEGKCGRGPGPLYSGFDIRVSPHKVAPVDANLFPAGFNNLSKEDQDRTARLLDQYLKLNHPSARKILLLTEEHTNNLHYWDNVLTIKTLIEKGGFEVTVCVAKDLVSGDRVLNTAEGRTVSLQLLKSARGDLIISNNDFSVEYDLQKNIPCLPPLQMGWKMRRKHRFFACYNRLAREFSDIMEMNPRHFQVETEIFSPFDVTSMENLKELKSRLTVFFRKMETNQKNFSSAEKPFVFLKNNYGTYGLGITTVNHPEEVLKWNYKTRKDLKATKGGGGVRELIIQEGIPTALTEGEQTGVEPVIYMVGFEPAGVFLRIHEKKDFKQNLNRPGVVYKPLSLSGESGKSAPSMMSVYSWIGRLGALAVLEELKQAGFDNGKQPPR